jgi:hypothetical protein
MFVTLTKHYSGDQAENKVMEGARSTHGGEQKCTHGFGWETQWKETTWKSQA